ncbi:hypothetical protein [Thalassovita mangrovi]|uniref:Glycosyltransferase 2-like domain-containing protein n=1 Tax=Thalassovita mangrovi TaxID=2692236 RepID=A0A6L8LJN7_9RHOB|nr:hypothetical protein [Thalassovita mangrovi]MYM56258.1 hypothetical protein [Thalassovita mangrovi]
MPCRFEFRIPVLPTPGFFSGVKLAVKSLRKLGGAYEAAPVVISVGGDEAAENTHDMNGWSATDENVIWRIIPEHKRTPEFSSGIDRFENPLESDIVVMCDADACLLRDIDPVLEQVCRHPRPMIAAMQAHQSPFGPDPDENTRSWAELFAHFGRDAPRLSLSYTLARPQNGKAPPYFNFGFVVMNRAAFDLVRPDFESRTLQAAALLRLRKREIFAAQIAMSVLIAEHGIDYLPLDPSYNCTNKDEMFRAGLKSEQDIRVLHYQRRDHFDRHLFLCCPEAFAEFSERDYDSKVIAHFRRHVLSLPDIFFRPGDPT